MIRKYSGSAAAAAPTAPNPANKQPTHARLKRTMISSKVKGAQI
jgi:hypothetical protein